MKKRNITEWLFPSIADVVFLCMFAWILHTGAGLLNDGDTGWHIRTGEGIINTMTVPKADPYSHTMPGTPWTAHEWLSEVVFAVFDRAMGLNGVVVLTASVICMTFLMLYRYMAGGGVGPLMAAVLAAFAGLASSLHWLARPHIFSFPLTLAFFIVLDSYQSGGRDRLRWLPLLMVLWVNLHAGFMLGLMFVFIYLGGNLVRCALSPDLREEAMQRSKRLGFIAALTLLATFINPQGYKILFFPFHLIGRRYLMDNIQEFLSPNLHVDRPFEAMLLVFLAVFIFSRKRPNIFEGAIALLLTHMSLYSARYIPLMALAVTPMVGRRAGDALEGMSEGFFGAGAFKMVRERLARLSEDVARTDSRFDAHLWVYTAVAACFAVALNGGMLGGQRLMDYSQDRERFPVGALDFALKNNISGNMFNNDSWGGYIIYRCYPKYRVFFDGRSDMYGVSFTKEYATISRCEPGALDVLDKYKVSWVIYNANAPICRLLAAGGAWKLVYADGTADILLKDVPENRAIIKKYKNAHFVPNYEQD